jgi:hypothetical protein
VAGDGSETIGDRVPRIDPARHREFAMSGREVDYFMPIVCTDRGQHKRMLLSMASRELNGDRGMSRALESFAPPMADAKPGSTIGLESYTFMCPGCGRTPQIKHDRWWWIIEEAVRAGVAEIDLSVLPF